MRLTSPHRRFWEFAARLVCRQTVPFRFAHPVISLTFDDYPRSALDLGGRILASEGLSATYYTAFGLANTVSASGRIGSLDDLAACVAAGHEVACHSFDHVDCYRASPDEFARNLDHNRRSARALGLPPLQHFAYPFGRFGVVPKRVVMQSYVSARTTIWGVNRSGLDLGMLKSVPIYSRYEPRLRSYLDELESRKGWLILYSHDVSRRPSPYGCTPEELSGVIRRARAMGALILPVGAVVDRLREAPLQGNPPEAGTRAKQSVSRRGPTPHSEVAEEKHGGGVDPFDDRSTAVAKFSELTENSSAGAK